MKMTRKKEKTAKTNSPDSDNELNGDFRIAEFNDKSNNEEEKHIP